MVNLRGLPSALLDAISGNFNPVILIHVDWPDSPAYVHSGKGDLIHDGNTYIGIGSKSFELDLPASRSALAELTGSITVTYDPTKVESGDPGAKLSVNPKGRAVTVSFGAVTERAGVTLIGDVLGEFAGYIDSHTDIEEPSQRQLVIQLRSGPSQRATVSAVHSVADQQRRHASDTLFRHFQGAQGRAEATVKW